MHAAGAPIDGAIWSLVQRDVLGTDMAIRVDPHRGCRRREGGIPRGVRCALALLAGPSVKRLPASTPPPADLESRDGGGRARR